MLTAENFFYRIYRHYMFGVGDDYTSRAIKKGRRYTFVYGGNKVAVETFVLHSIAGRVIVYNEKSNKRIAVVERLMSGVYHWVLEPTPAQMVKMKLNG